MNVINKNLLAGIVLAAIVISIAPVSGVIVLQDLWTEEWDQRGFIEYKNTLDHNVSGTLTVYVDDVLILEEVLNMHVIPFHGFLINKPEKLQFALNITSGEHFVTAYIDSGNTTVNATVSYFGEEEQIEEEEEEEEVVVEWLPCPCGGA